MLNSIALQRYEILIDKKNVLSCQESHAYQSPDIDSKFQKYIKHLHNCYIVSKRKDTILHWFCTRVQITQLEDKNDVHVHCIYFLWNNDVHVLVRVFPIYRAILVPATVIIFKKDTSKGIVNEKCITILNAQSWQMMCDLANNNNRLISRGHTKWGWSHFLHRYSLKGIEFLISKYAYFFVIRMICFKRLCGKCYLTTWHFFSIYAILFNSITIYVFIV